MVQVVRPLEVQHDAAFAAIEERLCRRLPAQATGWIDVNHVGALVCQHHRGQRSSDVLTEINHSDAFERSTHHTPRF